MPSKFHNEFIAVAGKVKARRGNPFTSAGWAISIARSRRNGVIIIVDDFV